MQTILDMLEFHAETHPEKTFLSEEDHDISFADLNRQVKRCAAILIELGIGTGDRLILHQFDRALQITTYLAAMRIGAIPVLVCSPQTASQVQAAIEVTGASMVVNDLAQKEWSSFNSRIVRIPDLSDDQLAESTERYHNKIAYMLLTGGVTGRPKAVMATHKNIHCVTRNLIRLSKMTQSERELFVMPLGSIGGLAHFHTNLWIGNFAKLAPYSYGSMTAENTEHMLDMIESEKISGFLSSPEMLGELVTTHREGFRQKAASVRYIIANGFPLRSDLVNELLELLPDTRLCACYGLTEASLTAGQCFNDSVDHISSVGQAMSGVEIKIDSATDQDEGEVLIRGGNVTCGYWGRDDALDDNGWFRTGEIGVLDSDRFLTIRGRKGDRIHVDGFKFLPSEDKAQLHSKEKRPE